MPCTDPVCPPCAQHKGMFKECLDRAAEEARAAGHSGSLPDTAALAARIEAAFFKHFGVQIGPPGLLWCPGGPQPVLAPGLPAGSCHGLRCGSCSAAEQGEAACPFLRHCL